MTGRYQFRIGTILVVTATVAALSPLLFMSLGSLKAADTLAAFVNGTFVLSCVAACVLFNRFLNEH